MQSLSVSPFARAVELFSREQTPIEEPLHQCNNCGTMKVESMFAWRFDRGDYCMSARCKSCESDAQKLRYRAKNPPPGEKKSNEERVLEILDMPMSVRKIADLSGMHHKTAGSAVAHLMGEGLVVLDSIRVVGVNRPTPLYRKSTSAPCGPERN